MLIEILKTSKLSQNKIYMPKSIQEKFQFREGETLVWGVNKKGDLILTKAESLDGF